MTDMWLWETVTRPTERESRIGPDTLDDVPKELLMEPEWVVHDEVSSTWWSWHLRGVLDRSNRIRLH
jgi:hypothetical protein